MKELLTVTSEEILEESPEVLLKDCLETPLQIIGKFEKKKNSENLLKDLENCGRIYEFKFSEQLQNL